MSRPRLGAYVLAADPTWLRSSVAAYYDLLDVLVVAASESGRGWTGHPVRADDCVRTVRSLDRRGIVRVLGGEWSDQADPLRADTAQRLAALDAVGTDVDWILQIDTDELLPDPEPLFAALAEAERLGLDAVEWPMTVLYRRLRGGRYLQVSAADGAPRYDYPGPIAIRPGVQVVHARQTAGAYLRPTVRGDAVSSQLTGPPGEREVRVEILGADEAIIHNSWARPPRDVRSKIASWGHNRGARSWFYYLTVWLPAPLRWRRLQNFHPLFPALWPRLVECPTDVNRLLVPTDR